MTRREAPLSVLKDLAEAVDNYDRTNRKFIDWDPTIEAPLRRYQASTAPLRSRDEVDAEIVRLLRDADKPPNAAEVPLRTTVRIQLTELLREPTSDPNPSGPDGESAVERALASDEPEPCGCEQSEALLQRLGRIRSLAVTYPSDEPHTALGAIRKVCG